jgi:hypothetical protein
MQDYSNFSYYINHTPTDLFLPPCEGHTARCRSALFEIETHVRQSGKGVAAIMQPDVW